MFNPFYYKNKLKFKKLNKNKEATYSIDERHTCSYTYLNTFIYIFFLLRGHTC